MGGAKLGLEDWSSEKLPKRCNSFMAARPHVSFSVPSSCREGPSVYRHQRHWGLLPADPHLLGVDWPRVSPPPGSGGRAKKIKFEFKAAAGQHTL